MAQQTVNVGTTANDGTGDALRVAFQKLNTNDGELYTAVAGKADASALASKANLSSPAFTDTPTAPTAAATTSTTQIATTAMVQAALAAYVAAQDVLVFKGAIDCSSNPNYPAADAGHVYKVSVAGRIGGVSGPKVEAGDALTCLVDASSSANHATVGANWMITQVNIDGAVIGPASATDLRIAVFDGGTGKLVKDGGATIAELTTGATNIATAVHGAAGKATPVDADELALVDSADSNALKKLTFANLKAWVKSWIAKADVGLGNVDNISVSSAWATYTPVITPESGSLTSYSVGSARYKQLGKTILFSVTFTISNNGSAAGAFYVTLPAAALGTTTICGKNYSVGKLLSAGLGGTSASMYAYDGTHPGTTGELLNIAGSYEAA